MKKVIINMDLEITCPNCKTDKEAKEYAMNYELPSGYVEDSFEFVKVVEEEPIQRQRVFRGQPEKDRDEVESVEEEERFCVKCGKTSGLIEEEDMCQACAEERGRD